MGQLINGVRAVMRLQAFRTPPLRRHDAQRACGIDNDGEIRSRARSTGSACILEYLDSIA
jgi:hypothetical protein